LIHREIEVDMPTEHGHFKLIAFDQTNSHEVHMALVKGTGTRMNRCWSGCTPRVLREIFWLLPL
jgi:GTP cyclohydrolase II